jgi:hypothetical protein
MEVEMQVPARPICFEERVPHHAPDSTQVQDMLLRDEWAMEVFGEVGVAEEETLIVVVVVDVMRVVTVVVESAQTRGRSEKRGRASNLFGCIFARVVWRVKMPILCEDKPFVFF